MRYQRVLFLLPIALMVVFCLYFQSATSASENNILLEKFDEKKLEVAAVAYQTDEFIHMDDNWLENHDFYRRSITLAIESMNRAYMTYAVLFDENLTPISSQADNGSDFDPMIYPEFIEAVHNTEIGDLRIHFNINEPNRDILVHYRWIPTGPQFESRFLVVVGISRFTIINQAAKWIQSGAIALILITTILNEIMVFLMLNNKKRPEETTANASVPRSGRSA